MKIKRDSWHYKMATWGQGDIVLSGREDLCAYIGAFTKAVIAALIAMAIVLLFAVVTGDFIGWIGACIACRQLLMPDGLAMLFMGLALLAVVLICIVYIAESDGLKPIRDGLRARKQSICPLVEFID